MRWITIAAMVLTTLCTRIAPAQPDEAPRVPRAITDSQFQRYCDILGVSDDQRHGAELEYERYLDEFEPLRTEMSAAAVKHPAVASANLELVQMLPGLIERTRAADESLFARLDPLLTDDQRGVLPRIRLMRERTLLCDLQTIDRLIGDGVPDLRALVESLDPPAEVIEPLVPSLDDYEARLTAGMRTMFDAVIRLCGTDEARNWFPRPMDQEVGPVMQTAIDRLIGAVRDLRTMNRRFFETTAPSLPEELRQQWRNQFLFHAYGEAHNSARMWTLTAIDAALNSDLSDDERQAVLALRDDARRAEEAMLVELIDVMDEEAIRVAEPTGSGGNSRLMDALNNTRQQSSSKSMEIRKSLQTLLGADRVKALNSQRSGGSDGPRSSLSSGWMYGVVTYTTRVSTAKQSRGVPALKAESLLPWPLDREELDLWLTAFTIDADARAAIMTLFAEYERNLAETLKPLQSTAMRNSVNVMMREPAADPMERPKAAEKARTDMRAAIDAADAEFLAQVRSTLGDDIDQAMWDRLLRLRDRTQMGLDMSWTSMDDTNGAGGIDLMRILLQQNLSRDDWAAIAQPAVAYEAAVLPLLQQQRDSIAKFNFDTLAYRDGWKPDRALFEDQESQHERYGRIGDLNRTTLQAVAAALPPATAARVIDAYNRRAHPIAFDDPSCMDAAMRQAQELKDLTPEQRERIATVRLAFDDAYGETLAQLIALCGTAPQHMPMAGRRTTEADARAEEQFNEEFARLVDARAEANRRALRGLRVALLPPQMRRLTLPETE